MTYTEFLENIEKYVGYIVDFTAIWKATGERAGKFQRYVWDSKEFGKPSKDALMEVTRVDLVKYAPLNRAER